MDTPESNHQWQQAASLKVRLRDHVQIHRHLYRDKLWYVLQDRVSAQYYRFGAGAYDAVRLMDGERTVEEIWQIVKTERGEDAPDKPSLINLLSNLHNNDLLHSNVATDMRSLFERQDLSRRAPWKRFLKSPFLLRVPLFDPEPFLRRPLPGLNLLFGRLGVVLWLALVSLAATLALSYWPELKAYWASRALAPYNLVLLAAVYPIVKGLHELAHALTLRKWGGEVHEMGVMMLLFMPLPYVDASAASGFRDKRQRMLVGAAGIMAELFVAALALFVWFSVETGIVRDIAFDVMLIGGISTLLFNGNPLIRFDGYYVLADAIEIPNLSGRSTQYYGYLAKRYLFGLRDAPSPVTASGESLWFVAYGLSSTLYRVAILLTIVLFVAEKFLIVGVLLGVLAISAQILHPLAKQLRFVLRAHELDGHRPRAIGMVSALAGVAIAGLCFAPAPSSTYAQGVVWLPEHAQVRAPADGFITDILAARDTKVTVGQALFRAEDPLVEAEVRTLEWALLELQARYDSQFLVDRAEAGILKEQIARARIDLVQARERVAKLIIRSRTEGSFLVPGAQHLSGRYRQKGEVLGYVTDLSAPTVRAVVTQADASLVRDATRLVQVRLADRSWETITGTLHRAIPSATSRLPSKALGTTGGGLVAVDPSDVDGLTSLDQIFLFDVELPHDLELERIGTRAHLRFIHDQTPVARQWYRSLRQLFLSRFAV